MHPIETARLRLCPWKIDDVDSLRAIWVEPRVRKYLFDDVKVSREQAAEIVTAAVESCRLTQIMQWSIRRLESPDAIIGFAGLRWLDEASRQPELIYGLAAEYWGQGMATEASKAVLNHGFSRLDLPLIWASTDSPNLASVGVMQRLGMTPAACPFAAQGLVTYRLHREEFKPLL